ncbi:GNAT family N-acetyltransferase [Streptomyces sp. NPDC091266]|uniref:GNAT family N-acetyltransferase n=1 Tax=Streptomyces sp. NPDC091266 TaxID=3365978 RepID=UPI0037FC9349
MPRLIFRTATHSDLPQLLALLAEEGRVKAEDPVTAPASAAVDPARERAFWEITADPRNELLVLAEGRCEGEGGGEGEAQGAPDGEDSERYGAAGDTEPETVLGFLQITYIPGLGRGGAERALLEAVRVRADRRGAGLGRRLIGEAVERARRRGCGLVQLTSDKRRTDAHRFYASLGFARSHDGFKLTLPER